MALFFDAMYVLVIVAASAAVGAILGSIARILLPGSARRLPIVPLPIGLAWWIWAGWTGNTYELSRAGLVFFAAVSALGFVRGWWYGLALGRMLRGRLGPRRRGAGTQKSSPRP